TKSTRGKKSASGALVREEAQRLSVTDYLSYRQYLKDLYEAAKGKVDTYSYMQFAQDLGLSKSNVLWLVVSGRRRLTQATLDKILKALKITGVQRRYFEGLVVYNNA